MIAETSAVVMAYVQGNQCHHDELPKLLRLVYEALTASSNLPVEATDKEPAVDPKRSVKNDFIICLEDGKQLKTLKRYLRRRHHLTPEEYRRKWRLPSDYPMVSPAYAAQRSALAKKFGLGRVPGPRRKKPK